MSFSEEVSGTSFDRARRRSAYRRLARVVAGKGERPALLPLAEAEKRLRPFARTYLGLRALPVRQVVGTDSRGGDFDREFLPQRRELGERWRSVERAFPGGEFPPIRVYQLGDAYFVLDGHHRVAIARQRGMETIDAEVTELRARWHLSADADVVALIHAEQERIFMEESGLADARPEARICFSRPVGYTELLENVQIHGYHLMHDGGRVLTRAEIAGDWYERVYLPAVEAISREGLDGVCAQATEADLFLCVYQRRRELFPEYGCRPLEEAAREVGKQGGKRARWQLRRPRAA